MGLPCCLWTRYIGEMPVRHSCMAGQCLGALRLGVERHRELMRHRTASVDTEGSESIIYPETSCFLSPLAVSSSPYTLFSFYAQNVTLPTTTQIFASSFTLSTSST